MDLIFIGCGNMGSTLLKSALTFSEEIDGEIIVVEKKEQQREKLKKLFPHVMVVPQVVPITSKTCLVMAVKPQDLDEAICSIQANLITKHVGVLSIVAGVTRDYYKSRLKLDSIIRAMPNTAGLLGAGVTGIVYDEDDEFAAMALRVLSGLGKVVKLEKEGLLDVVTAISGSGPAYFFYLVEQLKNFGVEQGLDADTAEMLARKTCYGAGVLLEHMDVSPEDLRAMVTSKGGTTEAAINYMTQKGIDDILRKAFKKAWERAKELAR